MLITVQSTLNNLEQWLARCMDISIFFVFITVSDIYVTQVGPFFDYQSCALMEEVIINDVAESMQNDFPHGMVQDKWTIGNGAIYRLKDYDIACEKTNAQAE
jgi:hypothetical protein